MKKEMLNTVWQHIWNTITGRNVEEWPSRTKRERKIIIKKTIENLTRDNNEWPQDI